MFAASVEDESDANDQGNQGQQQVLGMHFSHEINDHGTN